MKQYGRWRVTLPGTGGVEETHVWEPDLMTGAQCGELERVTGMSFDAWVEAIDEGRWDACRSLVWFLRRKLGIEQRLAEVDFPLRKLNLEQVDEQDRPVRRIRTRDEATGAWGPYVMQTLVDGDWQDSARLRSPGEAEAAGPSSAAATSSTF